MMLKCLFPAVLALSLLPSTSLAASSQWAVSGDTRMRLVVAEPMAGDRIVRALLEVALAPGWKTYWRDPGEAGVPLQLDLTGSENVALKDIHYPVPRRFDDGITEWAGYDRPVVFPIELERADAATNAKVSANIFIGICEEICVPFQTRLEVTVDNAVASNADQMAVKAAFDSLPAQSQDAFEVKTIRLRGKSVLIEAVVDQSDATPELFLASPNGWQFGAPKLVSHQGSRAQFEANVLFAPKDAAVLPLHAAYTLVSNAKAVSGVEAVTE